MDEETKVCNDCETCLPLASYYEAPSGRQGRSAICKKCSRIRAKARKRERAERRRNDPVAVEARCGSCGETKSAEEFSLDRSTPSGLTGTCKLCKITSARRSVERRDPEELYWERRAGHLRRKYGLTLEDYDRMKVAQGGRCKICDIHGDDGGGNSRDGLYVDHSHTTGGVRGLLCNLCNLGLGHGRENVDVMLSGIAYLEKHRARSN